VRVQARITLPESLREGIDAARLRWNPEVATGNPAHVTVVYHDEAPDLPTLRERFEEASRELPPFELIVGLPRPFPPPVVGAFLEVSDPSRSVEELRRRILRRPFQARPRFGLHVTLLHPAQGERFAEAWPSFFSLQAVGAFPVRSIELVSGSGAKTEILAVFELGGAARFPSNTMR
jgi:2'-5' RNA ligase